MSNHSVTPATQLASADWQEFVTATREAWEARGYDTTLLQSRESAAVFELTQTDSGLSLHRMCVAVQGDTETPLEQTQLNEYLDFAASVGDGGAIEFVTTRPVEARPEAWNGRLPVTVHSGEALSSLFELGDAEKNTNDETTETRNTTETSDTAEAPPATATDDTAQQTVTDESASTPETDQSTLQISQTGTTSETISSPASRTDGLFDIPVTETQYVELPRPLAVAVRRRVIAGLSGSIALILIWNPTGSVLPIEVLGTLLGLGAIGVLRYPERMWAAIVRDRARLGSFDTGEVLRVGETIQYVHDDGTTREFGAADSVAAAQRALVFGALDAAVESTLPKTEAGSVPTPIATEGSLAVAAYRVAAHETRPQTVADELGIDRSTLGEFVESLVGQHTNLN